MKRHTIALLFCGGTQLTNRPNRWERVQKPKDVHEWLGHVPELHIVADIVPHFIAPNGSNAGIETWRSIADFVRTKGASVDGVLVLHDIETVHYAANALSLMLRNLPIPVVLSGSPIRRGGERGTASPEFGARANVINALQVATSDIAEVCVVFGNRIMRGSRVQLELTGDTLQVTTADRSLLGRIDFGISLDSSRTRRGRRRPVVRSAIDPNVFTMTTAPGSALPIHRAVETSIHAILIRSAQDFLALTTEQTAELSRATRRGIPVIVSSPMPIKDVPHEFIPLIGVSSSMAVVKTMWAIASTKNRAALKKVLAQDTAHEHINGGVV